jgi:hypothetical protein
LLWGEPGNPNGGVKGVLRLGGEGSCREGLLSAGEARRRPVQSCQLAFESEQGLQSTPISVAHHSFGRGGYSHLDAHPKCYCGEKCFDEMLGSRELRRDLARHSVAGKHLGEVRETSHEACVVSRIRSACSMHAPPVPAEQPLQHSWNEQLLT